MAQLHVLVVGAGIAGSAHAYWLAKGGAKVTVAERAPKNLAQGQGIDIEGPARTLVRRMGLMDEIQARTTGETGVALVDDDGRDIATIGGGLTREIEILRGDLADILYTAAERLGGVTIRMGCTITELSQTAEKVTVTFNDGSKGDFDLVIGADGIRSKTRTLVMGISDCLKPRDLYVAFYKIPRHESDGTYARWQHAVGGRGMVIRPARQDSLSAFLLMSRKSQKLEQALGQGKEAQEAAVKDIFAGIGGLAPRLIDAMSKSDDFYFERIAQVKLPKWSSGRCALIGDAAHAPSPLTGEGTKLALMGAYLCAGEIFAQPHDPALAFEEYERKFRDYVQESQVIPLGGRAPDLANPQSAWAIWILRTLFRIIAWTGVWKLIPDQKTNDFALPEYPEMRGANAE